MESPKRHVGKAGQKLKDFVERGDRADKVLGRQSHPEKGNWMWTPAAAEMGHHSGRGQTYTCRSQAVGQNAGEIGQTPQNWSVKSSQIQNHSGTRYLNGHVARCVATATQRYAQSSANEDCQCSVESFRLEEQSTRVPPWHTLGCGIDPEFALSTSSVRLEAWKVRRGANHSTRQWKAAARGACMGAA